MGKRKIAKEPIKQPEPVLTKMATRRQPIPQQVQPIKATKSRAKPVQDDDFVMVLDVEQQDAFHENFKKYRERKMLSCVDQSELKQRDIFAPQENNGINQVSLKILIDEELPEPQPLFSLKDTHQESTLNISSRAPLHIKPVKLDYMSEESEGELDKLNQSHLRLQQSLLSIPQQKPTSYEPSLVTTEPAQSARKRQTRNKFIEDEIPEVKVKAKGGRGKQKAKQQCQSELFDECKELLQESAIPEEISCRDDEKAMITKFIDEGLKNSGQSQALYISGVPGIGKTATVMEVKNRLGLNKKKNFQFIYANAMNFGVPENVYTFLLQELTGIDHRVSRNQACLLLTELFTKGHLPAQYKQYESKIHKGNKILLLDECDCLITPTQQVLYNLVDWPSYKSAKLTVIMIANTMDFPERLKPKLQSRLGNHRLVFKPYTSLQIETIIQQRLKNLGEIFGNNSVSYIGKKVATVSTDIRKTLSICRIGIDIAKEEYLRTGTFRQVEIEHIKQAYETIYDKPYHSCLRQFNETLKLLIIAIALEIVNKGYNMTYLMPAYQRFRQLQDLIKEEQLSYQCVKQLLLQLLSINMIEIKEISIVQSQNSSSIKILKDSINKECYFNISDVQIQLKIGIDDIKNALRDDQFFDKFSKFF